MSDTSVLLPPAKRTALGEQLTQYAGRGELYLQHCADCKAWSYPPREVCGQCLSGDLSWQPCPSAAQVLSRVELHNSFEPYFSDQLPWVLLSVKLDVGPVLYVHGDYQSGQKINVELKLDNASAPVFWAVSSSLSPPLSPHLDDG